MTRRIIPIDCVCRHCGKTFPMAAKYAWYCSPTCQRAASHLRRRAKQLAARGGRVCAYDYCDVEFVPIGTRTFCSKTCLRRQSEINRNGRGFGETTAIREGKLDACRVYFRECVDCDALVASRCRGKSQVLCKECRRLRNRRRDAFKSHRRRGSRPDKPLSVDDIAKRDGTRCHYCHRKVDLSLSGLAKWGPTVEHIICISWDAEAAKDTTQHVLAHRFCNLSRHNTKPSQMVLALGA